MLCVIRFLVRRETRLLKYYLSGSDAFRLKLWLQPAKPREEPIY
jgi:hypothetical protein